MNKKKKSMAVYVIIIMVIVVAVFFLQRWYEDDEIDPVAINNREPIKEESVFMEYSFYRPFGEIEGEHVEGYYEVTIESGAVKLEIYDSDSNEVFYQKDFLHNGTFSDVFDIKEHKNFVYKYSKIPGYDLATGKSANRVVTYEHTGFYKLKDLF